MLRSTQAPALFGVVAGDGGVQPKEVPVCVAALVCNAPLTGQTADPLTGLASAPNASGASPALRVACRFAAVTSFTALESWL